MARAASDIWAIIPEKWRHGEGKKSKRVGGHNHIIKQSSSRRAMREDHAVAVSAMCVSSCVCMCACMCAVAREDGRRKDSEDVTTDRDSNVQLKLLEETTQKFLRCSWRLGR